MGCSWVQDRSVGEVVLDLAGGLLVGRRGRGVEADSSGDFLVNMEGQEW